MVAVAFMKLHACAINPKLHPMPVNLDLDMLLLKPLDILPNVFIYPPNTIKERKARQKLVNEGLIAPTYNNSDSELTLNKTFDSFYTRDYNLIRNVGLQGS